MTTTPFTDSQSIKARLEELRAKRSTFTTDSTSPLPDIRPAKTQHFRRNSIFEKATQLSLSEDAKQIDDLVAQLPMDEAIRMWGKPQSDFKRTSSQSVLIRCPNPEHPDRNPSANCDLEKGLFHCFSCDASGDKYTLAALHHGFGRDYQNGKNFVDLKKQVAVDLGYTITETGGQTVLTPPHLMPPQPAPQPVSFETNEPEYITTDSGLINPATGELIEPQQQTQPPQQIQPAQAPEPTSFADIELDEEPTSRAKPQLDWLPAGKNRSFIDRYMSCATKKGYPDSFGFAGALMCLGFVGNRNVKLQNKDPLHSGLGILTIAGTGAGKSRAMRDALNILGEVMPWRGAEMAMLTGGHIVEGTGVKSIPGAGSGENIIKQFDDTLSVPIGTNADGSTRYEEKHYPVNGAISFEELSQLVSKAASTGSTLRMRIMNFLDGANHIASSSNTAGSFEANRPFAFVYTSVQPKMVSKLITENDDHSGFVNRFAIFTGDAKPYDPWDFTPVPMDEAEAALKELKDFWDGQGEVLVTYTSAGADAQGHYYNDVIAPLKDKGGLTGRLDVLFWKLILLLCINECSLQATEDIVNKAIHLHRYFIETYHYVSGELYDPSSDREDDTGDMIVRRVKTVAEEKKAKGAQEPFEYAATAKEIRYSVKRRFAHFSSPPEALRRSLDGLCDIGLLVKLHGPRGARYGLPE